MSSLTTSSEGEISTPRFVVGSRDDETDSLGSNMKTDETDFFEDDEEEESVRSSQCSGLEHLCRISVPQPGFARSLLVGCVAQLWGATVSFLTGRVALSCCCTRCFMLQ